MENKSFIKIFTFWTSGYQKDCTEIPGKGYFSFENIKMILSIITYYEIFFVTSAFNLYFPTWIKYVYFTSKKANSFPGGPHKYKI